MLPLPIRSLFATASYPGMMSSFSVILSWPIPVYRKYCLEVEILFPTHCGSAHLKGRELHLMVSPPTGAYCHIHHA